MGLLDSLRQVSLNYGTGDLRWDVLVLIIGAMAITLGATILGFLLRKPPPVPTTASFERLSGIGGKVERLDRTVSELRAEMLREIEFLKRDVRALQGGEAVLPEPEITEAVPAEPPAESHAAPRQEVEVEVTAASDEAAAESAPAETPATLGERLSRSRTGFFQKLKGLFSSQPKIDQNALDELEATLIASDLGAKTTAALIEQVKAELQKGSEIDQTALTALFKEKIETILLREAADGGILPHKLSDGPFVVMVVGVNGVGKTTTVAKLAAQWKSSGLRVMMVAADTFRAAAVEQLVSWGERIGVPVLSGAADAKPSTVVFDAMKAAAADGVDVVIIDTAGRLQTKTNLMQELAGVRNVIERHQPSAPHETLLVLDGSMGQNALSQAREFNDAVKLSGLIITKLDGTSKGGIVVAIKDELNLPVRYIGVGEAAADLRPFDAHEFVGALFEGESSEQESAELSAHGETRRRKRRDTQAYI